MARTGGRIRSADAHDAVLAAATEMLEECGYQAITVEAIAVRAGVAKSTIYRWWDNKSALVMEAYTTSVARRMPEPDTGAIVADLTMFVEQLYGGARIPTRVRALRGLMAEAQLDPQFEEPFRTWIQTRRTVLTTILDRARDRGEIRPDSDIDLTVDHIFGVFWYRILVQHLPIESTSAAEHVEQLLKGLRP